MNTASIDVVETTDRVIVRVGRLHASYTPHRALVIAGEVLDEAAAAERLHEPAVYDFPGPLPVIHTNPGDMRTVGVWIATVADNILTQQEAHL